MHDEDIRKRALKMYPWLCARCGREFNGRNLRELTVHHKDHDHDSNPEDGSNWELLCLYCHDEEHSKYSGPSAGRSLPRRYRTSSCNWNRLMRATSRIDMRGQSCASRQATLTRSWQLTQLR